MALPKIHSRPPTTQLSTSMPAISVSSIYQVYPNILPPAPDIPPRVNPIQPPPPQKRTIALETIKPHWHNEQRTNRMKQREHYRYHNTWSKYYYGSPAEKEAHRKYIRSVLKQQMTDQWTGEKRNFAERVTESEAAVSADRKVREEDSQKLQRHNTFLRTYRDDNKTMMESAWMERRRSKVMMDQYDREQLKYNPINWSATLK